MSTDFSRRAFALASIAVAAGAVAGCGSAAAGTGADGTGADADSSDGAGSFPLTIDHALGTTTVSARPGRIAAVQWSNHEVPLALGVVPVGMAKANFGDDDGDGVLPWVTEKLDELGAEAPPLFDETDGIDFEAVSDTRPELILAGYSGLTQEDYDQLSKIAPTVAYPELAWGTTWRQNIEISSTAMGMADEGKALIADLEKQIADAVAKQPGLKGRSAMFLTHVDTGDLSTVSFYTTHDTRVDFFGDLGLTTPASIAEASAKEMKFSQEISAEKVDTFNDVDIIVTYGGEELIATLKADPLLSKMPAVANGAIVTLDGSGPQGTASNPTPLALGWVLEDYVSELAGAASKAE